MSRDLMIFGVSFSEKLFEFNLPSVSKLSTMPVALPSLQLRTGEDTSSSNIPIGKEVIILLIIESKENS